MLKKLWFLFFLIVYSIALANGKKYLIRIDNDLWIYYENKNSIYRLAYDKIGIKTATWSPDGKYIAYAFTKAIPDTDLIILNEEGKEVIRIPIMPLKNSEFENPQSLVRYVFKIEWQKENKIITESSIGPHGTMIDIWKIDSFNSYKHLKRYIVAWCGSCSLSPKIDLMSCMCYGYDSILQKKEEPEEVSIHYAISIFNLNKKESPEDKNFCDPEPEPIEIDVKGVEETKWISDYEVLIISRDEEEFWVYNLKEKKLEKIKELPKGVELKEIKDFEIEIKGKKQKFLKSINILDVFEEK